MILTENGPLEKSSSQFNIQQNPETWQISKSVLIGILIIAIAAGAIGYMYWDNYCKQKFTCYSRNIS